MKTTSHCWIRALRGCSLRRGFSPDVLSWAGASIGALRALSNSSLRPQFPKRRALHVVRLGGRENSLSFRLRHRELREQVFPERVDSRSCLRLYPAVWSGLHLELLILLIFCVRRHPSHPSPIPGDVLIPKGINGKWLDAVSTGRWQGGNGFLGAVFCTRLYRRMSRCGIGRGLTIYSAAFNAFSMVGLSGAFESNSPYWMILMFRVPAQHGC